MTEHKEKILDEIQSRISRLEQGEVTKDDIKLILIDLRYYTPNTMFEELAHFVAHPERDKGKFFEYLKPIVQDMVNSFKSGGKFTLESILTYNTLMDQFIHTLRTLKIQLNEQHLRNQTRPIVHAIIDTIDLTQINITKLGIPEIKGAVFEKNNQGTGIEDYYLWLNLSFDDNPDWVVKTYKKVSIGIPVISPK